MAKYLLSVICFVLTQKLTQQGNVFTNGIQVGDYDYENRSEPPEPAEVTENPVEDHSPASEELGQEFMHVTEHQLPPSVDYHYPPAYSGSHLGGFGHHSFDNFHNQHQFQYHEPEVHEMTKVIPDYQNIRLPMAYRVMKPIHVPMPYKVLEPYHIHVPVPVNIEKIVHVPVEKIVKYPVEKPVPVKVVKKVPFPVPQPYPVPVPVYRLKLVLHSKPYHHE